MTYRMVICILLVAATAMLLACSLATQRDEQTVRDVETPAVLTEGSATWIAEPPVAPASETTPIERTEYGHSGGSPETDWPAPLRLRIFEASAIVRATLISSSTEAVRYSAADGIDVDVDKLIYEDGWRPIDGEYRAAHTFRFKVTEYLKGSGASEITVTARTFSTHGTEEQALQVATDWLGERDTSRDAHEALLFLGEPASDGASNDAFHFLRSGPYHSLHYTIDTMNRVWLPAKNPPAAKGESSSSDDSSLMFLMGELVVSGSPTPSTMSLGELRSETAAGDALIAAGDGTDEYRECVVEGWRHEHWFAGFKGGEPFVPYELLWQLVSGAAEGTEVYDVSDYPAYSGPTYGRTLVEGVNKDLFKFALVDDDDRPDNGYKHSVATVRPLPAGTYQYKNYIQDHLEVPCNYIRDYHVIVNVVVTAPEGTLHELFFDPVTIGSGVAADAKNGLLKPVTFTDANGASATINSISYESEHGEARRDPRRRACGSRRGHHRVGRNSVAVVGRSRRNCGQCERHPELDCVVAAVG